MLRANFEQNYGFDPVRFFRFERFLSKLNGITLYYGFGTPTTTNDSNKKVLIDLETPNFLYKEDRYTPEEFDAIFMLCPYSSKYLNWKYKTNKFHTMWFPIDLPPELTLPDGERILPVYYTGSSMIGNPILQMIDRVLIKYLGSSRDVITAHISANDYSGYLEKLRILGMTKICIAHNVLHYNERLPNYIHKYMDSSYSPFLPWHGKPFHDVTYLPQLKSRIFEGALMGCVLLVFKDEYKTIEQYFEENKDFVYFDSEQDLDEKINRILQNYESYIPMAKSAQQKVFQFYGVEQFIDLVVRTLKTIT
jgi:hypothetical protein